MNSSGLGGEEKPAAKKWGEIGDEPRDGEFGSFVQTENSKLDYWRAV